MSLRYSRTKLVDINTNELFSKYFSETGKQITKAFDSILDILEEEDVFVLILIGVAHSF